MSELAVKIGKRLRQLRRGRSLTQRQLADAATTEEKVITRVFVGALERGEKTPSLRTLDQLAQALGVRLADLLQSVDGPRKAPGEPERLAELLTSLAQGAQPAELERFERVLRAFFDANRPRKGTRRTKKRS